MTAPLTALRESSVTTKTDMISRSLETNQIEEEEWLSWRIQRGEKIIWIDGIISLWVWLRYPFLSSNGENPEPGSCEA